LLLIMLSGMDGESFFLKLSTSFPSVLSPSVNDLCGQDRADVRIAREENDDPVIDVVGLRKMYDWVQQDAGKTVVMSGIQTVGAKSWE
jgi:hypothetical protein